MCPLLSPTKVIIFLILLVQVTAQEQDHGEAPAQKQEDGEDVIKLTKGQYCAACELTADVIYMNLISGVSKSRDRKIRKTQQQFADETCNGEHFSGWAGHLQQECRNILRDHSEELAKPLLGKHGNSKLAHIVSYRTHKYEFCHKIGACPSPVDSAPKKVESECEACEVLSNLIKVNLSLEQSIDSHRLTLLIGTMCPMLSLRNPSAEALDVCQELLEMEQESKSLTKIFKKVTQTGKPFDPAQLKPLRIGLCVETLQMCSAQPDPLPSNEQCTTS